MPPKNVTKERAWGTRYDSLGSWSESTPPSPELSTLSSSNSSYNKPTSTAHSPTLVHRTPEKHVTTNTIPSSADKMPHDASIFVGSLPSHIDHNELTSLLSEHLADYPEVKSVKVVRDNKGGICAFVQCEDAQSAAKLIDALQSSPPRPFIGRYLRFEPARAFRTLLVSYRAPTQFVRGKSVPHDGPSGPSPSESQVITLEPATAMRVFRPHTSKYLAITYNDEAKAFHPQASGYIDPSQSASDPFAGEGISLIPLKYDAEALCRLAAAFGPTEHFGEFMPGNDAEEGRSEMERIHPHDAPRSANMASKVWEIKWKHREDCVSALMTLRRIPHITVTWAHHQFNPFPGSETHLSSPNVTPVPRLGPFASPHRRGPLQSYQAGSPSEYQRLNSIRTSFSQGYGAESSPVPFKMSPSASQPTKFQVSPGSGGFAPTFAGSQYPTLLSRDSIQNHVGDAGLVVTPRWSDSDFPPLHTASGFGGFQQTGGPLSDDGSEHLVFPSPSSSLSVQPATPVPPDIIQAAPSMETEDVLGQSRSGSSPTLYRQLEVDLGQDVTVPPTPEHTVSTLTPVTPNSQTYPLTPPQSATHAADPDDLEDVFHSTPYNMTPNKASHDGRPKYQPDGPRQFDPFTIFVGGLDMYGTITWDEVKLRSIFGKYGEIEEVQIVRPLTKRSAFAFIRYKIPDAGARAVAEEHNRLHEGYQIRVQLRENNHSRGPWKFARGRRPLCAPDSMYSLNTTLSPGRGDDISTRNSADTLYTQSRQNSQDGISPRPHVGSTDSISGPPGLSSWASQTALAYNLPSPDTPSQTKERPTYHPVRASSTSTTTTSVSPSPSALGHPHGQNPMNGAVPQYPFPPMNMSYYPSQQWMQPYPPYGYLPLMPHGYMHCPQPPYASTPDGSGYPSAHGGWVAVNEAHKNQPTVIQREQSPLHAYPQHATQPPLRPTGFMQGEQGLIPVYQPDALNRYMSTGNRQTDTPPTHQPTHPQHAMWHQYPQMPMYPYMYPTSSMIPSSSHQLPMSAGAVSGQGSWTPIATPVSYGSHQAPYQPSPQPHIPASSSTVSTVSSSLFRHSVPPSGQLPSQQYGFRQPPTPRRYPRREPQYNRQSNNQGDMAQRHGTAMRPNSCVLSG